MINPLAVVTKLVSGNKDLPYIFGRFKCFRRLYSKYRNLQEFILQIPFHTSDGSTLFENISVDSVLAALEQDAVFLGLKLPPEIIKEIQDFATTTSLTREDGLASFYYHDVENGYLPDGRPAPQGIVVNPLACDAVNRIISDSVIQEILKKYLNYYPKKVRAILKWNFIIELPDEIRLQLLETVIYHHDIPGFNYLYINFYLTNTDEYSGAHVMIKGSHDKKSLKMLLSSAMQTDDFILNYYGQENELIIKGEEGFGFVQDPACYHKLLRPTKGERLFLQLRFS